jgi:hypothetical protein
MLASLALWDPKCKARCGCLSDGEEECRCKETGKDKHYAGSLFGRSVFGCPGDIPPVTARFFSRCVDYCFLIEQGVLPVQGGWEDQAEGFTVAVQLLLSARQEFEDNG